MSSRPVTTSKRLVYNTLLNMVTLVTNAAIGFCLIRFFLGQLGESRYGIWVLLGSVFSYREMLSMGMNSAINRYIPVCLAKNDSEGMEKVINTSLFFFSLIAIVMVVGTLVVYVYLGSWFAIDPVLIKTAGVLVLVIGFLSSASLPLQLSSAVLSGLQRYDIINIVILITLIIRTVLIVVLLLLGYGLIAMGIVFGLREIIVRLIYFISIRKAMPYVSISLRKIDIRLLREMLAYGINTLLYSVGALIICKASDIAVGVFLSTAYIARLSVATAVVLAMAELVQAFTAAVKPAVSDLDARNDRAKLQEVALLAQKYSLLLLIPVVFFLMVMGKELLAVWVGGKFPQPEIIGELSVVLMILAAGHGLRLFQYSNYIVLVGKGDHRIFGILTITSSIACIVLSILSLRANLGLIGVAWANFIPMAVMSALILPVYFNWKMKISTKESFRQVWLPAFLGSLPAVVAISVWKHVSPPSSWAGISSVVISVMALMAGASWLFGFSEIERQRFLSFLVPRRLINR